MGEASYLTAAAHRALQPGLSYLVRGVATVMIQSFGSFLIIEIWTETGEEASAKEPERRPRFRIMEPKRPDLAATVAVLKESLGKITISKRPADVEVIVTATIHPPGLPPLITASDARELGCHLLGIALRPIYHDPRTGQTFPLMRNAIHRGMARAFRKSIFEFTRTETTHRPPHYHSLGRRSMVKAVWEVDSKLAEISNQFDFLLLVTPTDTEKAWTRFRRMRCDEAPAFSYRPRPIDPALVKRQLFQVPIERIEDPTLALVFRGQQTQLDRKLTMLGDRGTKRFLYGSLQLFGGVSSSLLQLAQEILKRLPSRTRDESHGGGVNAKVFAARATEEIGYYHDLCPEVSARAELRKDLTGLMVVRGNLLIGHDIRIPASRVEALLQHEIGTHMLTYYNGRAQPFKQLYVGLSGYDELQEGLAVLAEYLVGGLSRPRLRLLAARVVAVQCLIDGASFVETYRELNRLYGFSQRIAFNITMRVHRSGGLTKDATYLSGIVRLLEYLKKGGELAPLFIGKIANDHVSIVNELRWRKVLKQPPLEPRYMKDARTAEKLVALRQGLDVLDLIRKGTT